MNMNSMAKIRIDDNTTADEVRRQLSDFSWFSKVEASTLENQLKSDNCRLTSSAVVLSPMRIFAMEFIFIESQS